jgi:glutaminyl-peptide cyclotransferase
MSSLHVQDIGVVQRQWRAMAACALAVSAASCKPYYDSSALRIDPMPLVSWTKLREFPHASTSFTEGLVYADGVLYESSGGAGKSTLIKSDPVSGAILAQRSWPGEIAGTEATPFAEGLALVQETLVQLSWENHRALTWTRADLTRGPELAYAGEGWGLCFDGAGLWRSDGTARLHRHVPGTFAEDVTQALTVKLNNVEVKNINELECIDDSIYANIWETPYVVIVRARDGIVTGVLDFSSLVHEANASGRESVLNGLAWDPAQHELYVTGKRWSKSYVVAIGGGPPAPGLPRASDASAP